MTKYQDRGNYLIPTAIIAGLLVFISVVTMVRVSDFNNQLDEQRNIPHQVSNPYGTPGGLPLPEEINQQQKGVSIEVEKIVSESKEDGFIAGALVLAIIYLATQGVGLMLSYTHGFASAEGPAAYNSTKGCSEYAAYLAKISPPIDLAEARLAQLQRSIAENIQGAGPFNLTFRKFLKSPVAPDIEGQSTVTEAVAVAKKHLESLSTSAEKLDFMDNLEPSVADGLEELLAKDKEKKNDEKRKHRLELLS